MKIQTKTIFKDIYIFFIIIYILCLPLNAMNIGLFGSALKLLAVIPIVIALLSVTTLRLSKPILWQLAFTLFAFVSIYWSVSVELSLGRVVSYVLLFALLISGSVFMYTEADLKKIKYALVWSSRLTAVVMLVFADYVDGRFRLMGIIEEDPNYLCAYLAFGVVYGMGVLTSKKKLIKKLLAVAELTLYLYLVLVSGSRGGLLAIIAAAVVYLMTYGNKSVKSIGRKLIFLTLIFTLVMVMIDYLPEYLKVRFTVDNVVENGGTGRTELWGQVFDLFINGNVFRQLFGYGTATIVWCFERYGYSEVKVAHNMFLETLAELGVVGLILYAAAIFSFIKAAFKFKDKFSFSVIICMFILSLSTSIYTFKPYFNIMLFIIMLQNMQAEYNNKSCYIDERDNTFGV